MADPERIIRHVVQHLQRLCDLLAAAVAHQTGNRKRQRCKYLSILHEDKAALLINQSVDCRAHFRVGNAYTDDVVGIVRNRQRDSPALNAVAFQKPQSDPAGIMVPLEHSDLCDVLSGFEDEVAVCVQLHMQISLLCADSARDDLDRLHKVALQMQPQVVLGKCLHVHRSSDGVDWCLLIGQQVPAVLGDLLALNEDGLHTEILQIVKQHNVCPPARCQCAAVLELIALRRVECRHADGHDRIDAGLHELPQMAVDMTLSEDGFRLPVIGAENQPSVVVGRDARNQILQIVARGPVAQLDIHAALQAVLHFLHRRTLMVCLHPCGDIRIQPCALQPRAVSVDHLVHRQRDQQLVQVIVILFQNSGDVHELAQPRHVPVLHRPLHVEGIDNCSGVLKWSCRHAARNHVPD